ncbi:MAG: hypothetical protein ABI455_11770 [Candidatus Dormiibacterota bacterium]
MSVTLLVALLGVTGLGWWVLREDARNRKVDDPEEYAETDAKPKEALH